MSKMTWMRWGLVLAGSTAVALNLAACVADFLLQQFILAAVN